MVVVHTGLLGVTGEPPAAGMLRRLKQWMASTGDGKCDCIGEQHGQSWYGMVVPYHSIPPLFDVP